MMAYSYLQLKRLVIFKGGSPVYDEPFHNGLNVICGENGSGKSTILDFIFYVLGGENIKWKQEALWCEYVAAEVDVAGTTLTLRRDISAQPGPIMIFNGCFQEAEKSGFNGWQAYQPNRARTAENELNFSQIIFQALAIPTSAASGSSNLTMHQILRLLYCDQMLSPVQRIFRFERFDQPDTRESVGDLMIGAGGVELYEKILDRRTIQKQFDEIALELKNVLSIVRLKKISLTSEAITAKIKDNELAIENLGREIANSTVEQKELRKLQADQEKQSIKVAAELSRIRSTMADLRMNIANKQFELADDYAFIDHLNKSIKSLEEAEITHEVLGSIKFEYCPSCLTPLDPIKASEEDAFHTCYLCQSEVDQNRLSNKMLNIKIDFTAQLKEAEFLVQEKTQVLQSLGAELHVLIDQNRTLSREYDVFAMSVMSSYETKISSLSEKIGYLRSENENLASYLSISEEVDRLSGQKANLQAKISRLNDEIEALEIARNSRRRQVNTAVSRICVDLLKKDLARQEQFSQAQNVDFSFRDDSIMVDGTSNFSASGIVVLKNTFHLSLFLASIADKQFRFPKFTIMDTTEDKGMEDIRSHRFQENVASSLADIEMPHQFILTTSMISPILDNGTYVVGRKYSRANKTLQFATTAQDV